MTLTILLSFIFLYVLFSIIAPQVLSSTQLLVQNSGNYIYSIFNNINKALDFLHLETINIAFDSNSLMNFIEQLQMDWNSIAKNISSWAIGTGTSLLSNIFAFTSEIFNWFTGFILSIYLLFGKEKYLNQVKKVMLAVLGYKVFEVVLEKGREGNRIFNRFISGQLTEACILGTIYFVVLSLLNFPFAMLISCVIAITSIVPIFGAVTGMVFGSLLILAVRPFVDTIWFIVIFQLIQLFEGNVIYPRVVGKSVGLPGVWVLLSIIIFGSFWGLFGMLIAVPTTAIIYGIIKEIVNYKLNKSKLNEI